MFKKVKDKSKRANFENSVSKLLYKLLLVFALIIVVLIICIATLFPLKEKVPYLVYFSQAQQNFAEIKQVEREVDSEEWINESLLLSYVSIKETKNNIDDNLRQTKIKTQSTYEVYKTHKDIYTADNSIFQRKLYTREIDIISVNLIPNTNIGQVEFQATLKDGGLIKDVSNFRVVMQYRFGTGKSDKIKYEERGLNPLGFIIESYTLSLVSKEKIKRLKNK